MSKMSFNPPLPFDPCSQADYAGWCDMINSIVGFVTASTHLASTLRNSRCCFPDFVEITEVLSEKNIRGKSIEYSLIDFPWFVKELNRSGEISPQYYRISEIVPLIQYPIFEVMHGEPNTEPRTFTLIDTKDFGDVNLRKSIASMSVLNKPNGSLNSIPSVEKTKSMMQQQTSDNSCFFEDYTDSEQTIDSSNFQENFETIEEQRQRANAKSAGNTQDFFSSNEIRSTYEDFKLAKPLEKSDEIEQYCTIYEGSENTSQEKDKTELILECSVEDTQTVSRKKREKDKNNCTTEENKAVSTCAEAPKIYIKDKGANTSRHAEIKPVATCAGETQVTPKEKKRDIKEQTSITDRRTNMVCEVKELGRIKNVTKVVLVGKKMADEKEKSTTKGDKPVSFRKKLSDPKNTDKESAGNKEKNKIEKVQGKNELAISLIPAPPKAQKASRRSPKRSKEGNVDFITKNIVDCLNASRKTSSDIKNPTPYGKSSVKPVYASPKDKVIQSKEKFVSRPITPNTQAKITITNEARSRRASDRKSFSADEVKPSDKTKGSVQQKIYSGVKRPIQKTVSHKEKPSSRVESRSCIPKPTFKLPEKIPEIKSCLRSTPGKNTGTQKVCVIHEDALASSSRPKTAVDLPKQDRILPKVPIVRDVTLKLTAAETVRKASELLRNVEEKVLQPTTAVKRQVVSGAIRPSTICYNKIT